MIDLLSLALVGALVLVVDAGEVGDDDWHGQGDDQHAGQRADAAHYLASDGLWYHVAVPATRKPRNVTKYPTTYLQTFRSDTLSKHSHTKKMIYFIQTFVYILLNNMSPSSVKTTIGKISISVYLILQIFFLVLQQKHV